MTNFLTILKNDFNNYLKYNILQIVIAISIVFAGAMAFIPGINALIFIYITVFILPVIVFSISIFIEKEERTLIPLAVSKCSSIELIIPKLVSALILLLVPYILYSLVMAFVLHMSINILLFFLIYVLGATMHIIVGIVLAMISKSTQIMSITYIGYIVLFSLIPFFYADNLIPQVFQYMLVISPAYLSGVLFQEIYYGYAFSSTLLIVLSIILQFVYIGVLTIFAVRPYFKSYLLYTVKEEQKRRK